MQPIAKSRFLNLVLIYCLIIRKFPYSNPLRGLGAIMVGLRPFMRRRCCLPSAEQPSSAPGRCKNADTHSGICVFGAAGQIRTADLILTKDALYLLSYSSEKTCPFFKGHVATKKGLEPSTSGVTGRRSNQLNYLATARLYYQIHFRLSTLFLCTLSLFRGRDVPAPHLPAAMPPAPCSRPRRACRRSRSQSPGAGR